jgi:alkanesulfonate monooxygenase SsuD/methylene tetrahydromethanopterin reductase-like flavin-dependent oxidoreductase (luciferase family)
VTGLGVIFRADRPPEALAEFAAAAESAGLDELWLWEDCFLAGATPIGAVT